MTDYLPKLQELAKDYAELPEYVYASRLIEQAIEEITLQRSQISLYRQFQEQKDNPLNL
jgi:hypothetical protein